MKTITRLNLLKEVFSGIRIERLNDSRHHTEEIAKAHRNEHYICLLLESGTSDLMIDFREVRLSPGSMLFMHPNQIKSVISANERQGWILFFDEKQLDDRSRLALEEFAWNDPVFDLSDADKEWFLKLFQILDTTSQITEMGAFHKPAVMALLLTAIYRIAALSQDKINTATQWHSQRSLAIEKNFRKLLQGNFRQLKKTAEYAALMNISLGYLNDTVKSVTGNSVSIAIQQEIIREAQRLLCYSGWSVKEIATDVGFEDAKYFSRFFSKATGISPVSFRKKYQDSTA